MGLDASVPSLLGLVGRDLKMVDTRRTNPFCTGWDVIPLPRDLVLGGRCPGDVFPAEPEGGVGGVSTENFQGERVAVGPLNCSEGLRWRMAMAKLLYREKRARGS